MPTTRSRGLSTADLDTLRTAVEAGRKPKVQFTAAAGQVAGQIGQVVRFDDPTADEWVVVRFGRDELPFAPGDLQLPPPKPPRTKSTPATATAVSTSTRASSAGPAGTGPASAGPAASRPTATGPTSLTPSGAPSAAVAAATTTTTRPVTSAAATPATSANAAASAAKAAPTAKATAPSKPPTTSSALTTPAAPATTASASAGKGRPARKAAGGKRAPDLTVTLSHHDGQWTVQAAKGARVLIKPTTVRAADALRMVGQLDSPAVAEAVEEIVAAARAEAEDQAARPRRELAEVEAALADLSDAD
jgi:hypothetical protein